jgi:threonine/homoserine/homoserine lactone efflux protein
MIEALGAGILFGLSAGLAPGPLFALVIAQTLRFGVGHGVRVALAPLLTDLPIVAASVLLVGSAGAFGWLPAVISLAGAVFVASLALDTWRAQPSTASSEAEAPKSWIRGFSANLLSPHPYLFWLLVGAPTLVGAVASAGPVGGAAFIAGFYGCLVGSKVLLALLTARAGRLVGGRGWRLVMRGLALLLAVFAAGLLREAVLALLGAR